jgi:hypothetical protein
VAAVDCADADGDSGLVVFVVTDELDADAVRQAMSASLPFYMVPRDVVALAELPITARGKIDYAALRRRAAELAQVQPDTAATTVRAVLASALHLLDEPLSRSLPGTIHRRPRTGSLKDSAIAT